MMRAIFSVIRIAFVLSAIFAAGQVFAQQQAGPSALVADNIRYNPDTDELVATGNVEVLFDGRVLRAGEITYSNETGELTADGPLVLSEPGQATFVADIAELDTDARLGIIRGAQLVLEENLQFAAAEARSTENGRVELYRTIASSCLVCESGDTPLWLIRAEKIVRDPDELQIHFKNARFELLGITIGYLPYFRIPDPSVARATGFLQPEYRNSGIFGFGVRVPYFIVIDDHSDITITPFPTTEGALILETEYRRRFRNAGLELELIVGDERLEDVPDTRAFGAIRYFQNFSNDFRLDVDIELVSDDAFLRTYRYSDTDRLDSEIRLFRERPTEFIEARAAFFQGLRDDDVQGEIPFVLPDVNYHKYWDDAGVPGRLDFTLASTSIFRTSGRDVGRAEATIDWTDTAILPGGFVAKAFAGTDAALYLISDDPDFPSSEAIVYPTVGAELRWPLVRKSGRATQVIEPVIQVVYSDVVVGDQADVPNEDSLLTEFDAANLFSTNRFPGSDLREVGLRFNVGTNLQWIDPSGLSATATIGQVFRTEPTTGFADGTGLNGLNSNLVAATAIDFPKYLKLSNQALFDDSLSFFRNDLQASLTVDRASLNLNYVFLVPETSFSDPGSTNEITVSGRYKFHPNWTIDGRFQRDLELGENVRAGGGLSFANECLSARFSVSRRFTTSDNVPASTEFDLDIAFIGLGSGPKKSGPTAGCIR